jgi:hypothetical protein
MAKTEIFEVRDELKEGAREAFEEMPLRTLAWRAQRAELMRQYEEKRERIETFKKIAMEVYQLYTMAKPGSEGGEAPPVGAADCMAVAENLGACLSRLDVSIMAPENAPYTSRLMDLIENIAQEAADGIDEPIVGEIMRPAILYGDELIQAGKAVIKVPKKDGASAD